MTGTVVVSGVGLWKPEYSISNDELVASYNAFARRFNTENAAAIEAILPLVGPDTVVLTQQNGVDNGEQLAAALGPDHVMIGSAFMEGRIVEPGVVYQ